MTNHTTEVGSGVSSLVSCSSHTGSQGWEKKNIFILKPTSAAARVPRVVQGLFSRPTVHESHKLSKYVSILSAALKLR